MMPQSVNRLTRLVWQRDLPPHEMWDDALALAQRHGLLTPVAFLAREWEPSLPGGVSARLRDIRLRAVAREVTVARQIEHLSRVAAELDQPVMLLKGPVMAHHYPHPAARTFCDLDMLATSEQGARLLNQTLGDQGYRVCSSCRAVGQVPAIYPPYPGVRLEIHYRLGEGRWELPIAEIWNRALPPSDGTALHVMERIDHALYVMAHAMKHALDCGLRWLYDLTCWTRDWEPATWMALVTRARQWGMEPTLRLSCGLWAQVQEIEWDELPFGSRLEALPADVLAMGWEAALGGAPSMPMSWRDGTGNGLVGWLRYGWTVLTRGGEIGVRQIPGRVAYLVRQHGPVMWQLMRGNADARESWSRRRRLFSWLEGNEVPGETGIGRKQR